MAARIDRLRKRIVWLHLLHGLLMLVVVAMQVIRLPLAVPSVFAGILLAVTTLVGVVAWVILPLYKLVSLKAKDQVPIRYRANGVVSACFLLVAPVYVLKDYFLLPPSLASLLTIAFGTTFAACAVMLLFLPYFYRPPS